MYRYNPDKNELTEVEATTFAENGLVERGHIEEWVRKNPTILDESLLIIAQEYDGFEKEGRLDLLAVHSEGDLVVIELKRDASGSQVDFQAMKYCSYCATLTPKDIVEIYQEYIKKFDLKQNALETLMAHVEAESEESLNEVLNRSQKIILAGRQFDDRILSVAAWLCRNNIDIRCIEIRPYKHGSGDILIDINQLIPTRTLEDFAVRRATPSGRSGDIQQPPEILAFFRSIVTMLRDKGYRATPSNRRPQCAVASGVSGSILFKLYYRKRRKLFEFEVECKDGSLKEKLFAAYDKHSKEIADLTGLQFEKSDGQFNAGWSRLTAARDAEERRTLDDHLEPIGASFLAMVEKFREIFQDEL